MGSLDAGGASSLEELGVIRNLLDEVPPARFQGAA
jgi:hypothetical protein